MQALFDYLDGLALLDLIFVGAVIAMGLALVVPDLVADHRRRRVERNAAAFAADHASRVQPLAGSNETQTPHISPPQGRSRRDLPTRGGSSDLLSAGTGRAADTSLLRPRPDLTPTTTKRNRRR